MSLRLSQPSTVPPGGFRYLQKETGTTIRAASSTELKGAVIAHRRANSLPVGLEVDREIETQLCEQLPPGWCDRDGIPVLRLGLMATFHQVLQGTAVMADWLAAGCGKVEPHEAERRAQICWRCEANVEIQGCSTCNLGALHNVVNRVAAGKATSVDHALHACAHCGCSNRAQIHLPLDILQRHIGDDLNSKLPDHCWKKRM